MNISNGTLDPIPDFHFYNFARTTLITSIPMIYSIPLIFSPGGCAFTP